MHSGHPNTGLQRYSNSPKQYSLLMVKDFSGKTNLLGILNFLKIMYYLVLKTKYGPFIRNLFAVTFC